jgi:ABC-type multidrug transport system fused ATPase/permease subunit
MRLLKLPKILTIARRLGVPMRVLLFLFLLNCTSVLFEVAGVGMLLPVFELLQAGAASPEAGLERLQGRHWDVLRSLSSQSGIPITLGLLLSISFGLIVMRQIFSYFSQRYQGAVERELSNRIRHRAFHRFLFAQAGLQDHSRVGDVVAVLNAELRRALEVILSIPQSLTLVVQAVAYLGALFLLSAPMTALALVVMIGIGLALRGTVSEVKRRGGAISAANRDLSAFMVERLKHTRLIRLSGTEKAESQAVYNLSKRYADETLKQKLASLRMSLVPEPVAAGVAYLMLFMGGQVFGLSFEKLGLFSIVLIRLMPIVRGGLVQYVSVVGKMPSLERLDDYLTQTLAEREPKGGAVKLERVERGIEYRNLTFSYRDANAPAIWDVSVGLPAHRMSALVGPSGAGKSTFVDLLPRLRVPSAGEIYIDDVALSDFSVASLRGGIAFVPQQPQIFNISAAEHIRYGKDDATDEEVREAARLAGALTFIEALPQGFETALGEGGLRLSGGQRQRLDIARALVRRAPILILDEPTSALDADAEAAFRDVLRTLRRETQLTIIVIAHRISTIADADRIIVLRQGRVEAVGDHDALMAAGGWYASAYHKQHHRVAEPAISATAPTKALPH